MKQYCFLALCLFIVVLGCHRQSNSSEGKSMEFAQSISEKILNAQKNGGFYKLSNEEATDKMILGLNENLQKASYQHIKTIFGDYKSLELDTVVKLNKDKVYKIYRFRGNFEKTDEVEVRSVLDSNGRLAGFFVIPWKENL